MANTFHVAVYVQSIPEAVEKYRKLLGIEPAKVRHDYAKFELETLRSSSPSTSAASRDAESPRHPLRGHRRRRLGDGPREAGEVPLFQQEGTTCCYAKADKFWVRDRDGIPWEMYTLLEDADAETAADPQLRAFLGQAERGGRRDRPGAGLLRAARAHADSREIVAARRGCRRALARRDAHDCPDVRQRRASRGGAPALLHRSHRRDAPGNGRAHGSMPTRVRTRASSVARGASVRSTRATPTSTASRSCASSTPWREPVGRPTASTSSTHVAVWPSLPWLPGPRAAPPSGRGR